MIGSALALAVNVAYQVARLVHKYGRFFGY
jgi:hypothetical protein